MTTTKSKTRSFQDDCDSGPRKDTSSGQACEALDKSSISELSTNAINGMTCDELVRMIQVSELPRESFLDLKRRLRFYDIETLKRLAHLARRCCQNRGY